MSLKLNERYPGRFTSPSADYPQGSFKNRTSPTAKDGSYLEKDWANDKEGFFQSLISVAGVTPNGTADKVGASQYYDALLTVLYASARKTPILTDTGVAGAYAAANTPPLSTLPSTGYFQRIKIANLNPGASTYSPDGLAAKPIYGLGLQPLQGGELPAGVATLVYLVQAGVNGGNGAWIIIESLGGAQQVSPATKSQHAIQVAQAQAGFGMYALDGASPNVYSANYAPVIATIVDGMSLRFKAQNANTGASTFSANGGAAKAIVGLAGAALQGGEITSAGICTVVYSLSLDKWVLTSCSGGALQIPPGTQSQHAMQVGQATGRLIGIQRIASSGTYTPTSGTNSIIVDQTGAGGGGGGVPATAGGQLSVGGGGGSGARAMSRFTSGFSGVTVTIGTGGTAGAIGGNGGNGGQTSFGALLITAGGLGGTAGPASSAAPLGAVGGDGGALPTLGNMLNMAGQPGQAGVALSANSFFSGAGANSCFGGGGGRSIPTNTSPGIAARGPGAGGGGGANGASSSGQIGGVGGDGSVLVYEYS